MLKDEESAKIINEKIEQILSRREFQKPNDVNPISDMINRLWESIKEWINSILFKDGNPERKFSIGADHLTPWVQGVLRVLLIVIAVVVIFIVIRVIIRKLYFRARTKGASHTKADDFLDNPGLAFERVNELISKKDYTNAFRYLFICVLLKFHQREVIHIEKWKTNRIYIREISTADNELADQMHEFSAIFNSCCYGGRTINENQIDVWLGFFRSLGEDEK